jgi:hypothetical protein
MFWIAEETARVAARERAPARRPYRGFVPRPATRTRSRGRIVELLSDLGAFGRGRRRIGD